MPVPPCRRSPCLALATGLAIALAGCQPSPDPAAPAASTPAGDEAPLPVPEAAKPPVQPALEVVTVDGTPWSLAERRGRWVVVNYWATWCTPCLKEMPELSALDAMREHIEVIGLAYEDIAPAEMQAFLERHPVVYPIAIVDTASPPADLETPRGLPMTWLIDPEGRVAERFVGPVTAQDIEAAIAAHGDAS